MCQCSQFDVKTGRCRSGWISVFPVCRGIQRGPMRERQTPYCMWENPPTQFTREDGLPIGWPDYRRQDKEGDDGHN